MYLRVLIFKRYEEHTATKPVNTNRFISKTIYIPYSDVRRIMSFSDPRHFLRHNNKEKICHKLFSYALETNIKFTII